MEFDIPTDIAALSDADLATALEGARAALAILAARPDEEWTDEDLAFAEGLQTFMSEGQTASTERIEAAAARAQRIEAARAASVTEPEPVVAAAPPRRPVARRAAAAQPEPVVEPPRDTVTLTAAADVPGFAAGQALPSLTELTAAVTARMKQMPSGRSGKVQMRLGVATITKPRTDGLTQADRSRDDLALLEEAGREARLTGNSLVAAGGWCAPSETLYDLLDNGESTDGLIDIPEIGITRGGINFTKGPQFEDIYTDTGFVQTEAQAIAGDTKAFYDVECPAFSEVRLDAIGLGIRAGILTQVGYPEVIQRYVSGALVAHQHRVSARVITSINTLIGAATTVTNPHPTAFSLLTALELVGEGERQRYRLSFSETLEVLLPRWARAVLRADLGLRAGVEMTAVTDEQINSHFAVRGMRVQWLYNYQPLTIGAGATVDYPATIEAIMYPAGTFVKGTTDVITLDAVYDTAGLAVNTYTALFVEEGILVANRRNVGKRISMALPITGMSGAALLNDDWGTAQTPGA